jgi:hypothetical protein
VSFRASPSLRRRVAHARRNQAFGFESFQSGVQRARRDVATCAIRKLCANRDAVGVVVKPENREEDELFEFAEIYRRRHLDYIVAQIDPLATPAKAQVLRSLDILRLSPQVWSIRLERITDCQAQVTVE